MSTRTDYIPRNASAFAFFMKNMLDYVKTHLTEWGHIPESVITGLTGFLKALNTILHETHERSTPAQNLARREAQAAATRAVRAFVNQYLRFAPVTNVDRVDMGITNRDTIPTTIPPPSVQVIGTLRFPGVGLVDMYDIKPDGIRTDDRAKYGVRIHFGIISATSNYKIAVPPRTGADLPHSVFTRRTRHRFDFMGEHGNKVYFCLRYENSKGQAGPWGKILSAYVP